VDGTEELRMLAIRQTLGEVVGADELISTGLDALLRGVDTPSLRALAGLMRAEEPEAQDLFRAVGDELGLFPSRPADPSAARWALVRSWCREIVAGHIRPEVGGRLIWLKGWNELGYPDALQPLVGWVSEWEDWTTDWDVERDEYARRIVAEAETLLLGEWPPS